MKPSRMRDERGVAMLEVALTLPVLLLLLFGIIEFGIMLARLQVISNASSEAARAAGLFLPPCSVGAMQARADAAAQSFGGQLGLTQGDLVGALAGSCASQTVTYTINYAQPIPIVSGLVAAFGGGGLGPTIPLTQAATEFNANSLLPGP